MFFERDTNFPGGFIEHKHVLKRRVYQFVEQTLYYLRTDTNFPRNHYLILKHQEPLFIIEQISIFPGASIFSSKTDIHFPGSPI